MKYGSTLKKRLLSLILVSGMVISSMGIIPSYAEASPHENAIAKAADWLKASQNGDGSWGADNEQRIITAWSISGVLSELGTQPDVVGKSTAWLLAQELPNLDFMARVIAYMPADRKSTAIKTIIDSQNDNGGWGISPGFESDCLDTALMMRSLLLESEYKPQLTIALQYLLANQNGDGSWGLVSNGEGSIFVTGLVRSLLVDYVEKSGIMISDALNKSAQWLKSQRNAEGRWDSGSYIYNTYFAFMGLSKDNWQEVSTVPATVVALQQEDGSWNGDPYTTSLMVDILLRDMELAKAEIKDIKLLLNGIEASEFTAKDTVEIMPVYTGRDCTIEVTVSDENGNEYSVPKTTEAVNGTPDSGVTNRFYWNTELKAAGAYTAKAVMKDAAGQIKAEMTKQFVITPYMGFSQASVEVTPNASTKDKPVSPGVNLLVDAETNISVGFDIDMSVLDMNGNQIYSNTISSSIQQGENNINLGTFPVDNTMQGVYTVNVKLGYQDRVYLERKSHFRIIEQTGSIYTLNSDFDKGIMKDVSYKEVADQLQLIKASTVPTPGEYTYNSMVFTVADIVFFSYEDNTELALYNSAGTEVWKGILDKGKHKILNVPQGVYKAGGSKKFSVLSGDPVTNGVVGYYAMDQNGYGASTELYTWVPSLYGSCHFIVFAYEDGTNVEVKNTDTGESIWSGTLDKGQHWTTSSLSAKWLTVTANNPVSALTDYDQSYFAPSANKKWSGTEFYTYVGNTGNWPHDLTVMSYADNNSVVIKDTTTGSTLWSGTVNKGQAVVARYPYGANKYLTVTSSDTVTVCVQPWVSQTSNYHQGTYVADSQGSGLGTEFIATTMNGGYLYVLGYKDDTTVNVYNSMTGAFVRSYTIRAGQYVNVNPGNGLWRVTSNNNVSMYSGFGSWNAGFAPVEFGEAAPPKEGTWNVIHDGGTADSPWTKIVWHEQKPEGTNIEVKARAANTFEALASAEYKPVVNGINDGSLKGRFIQAEVRLTTLSTLSPVLEDILFGNGGGIPGQPVADAGDDQILNMISSGGTVVLLDGTRSYDPDGDRLTYKWSWNGGQAEGAQPTVTLPEGTTEVTLVVNDGTQDSEPDKVNITVVGYSSFKSSLATDKTEYNKDETVSIVVNGKNESSLAKSYELTLDVLDSDGNVVANIINGATINLSGGQSQEITGQWITGTALAGRYAARAVWKENGALAAQNICNFDVKPDGSIKNKVVTDKVEYGANEAVNITETVNNTSLNSITKGLIVKTSITNSEGSVIWNQSNSVEEILQNGSIVLKSSWNTLQTAPGQYKVTSEVYKADLKLTEDSTTFSIIASTTPGIQSVAGRMEVKTKSIYPADNGVFDYELTNTGNTDIDTVTARIRIVDVETATVLGTIEATHSLGLGGTVAESKTWSHGNLKTGNYMVVFDAVMKDGREVPLASGYIRVEKPYEVAFEQIYSPVVLVWAESQSNVVLAKETLDRMQAFYTIVNTREDFMAELRTGKYNQYMLLDSQLPLTDHDDMELANEVAQGKGIIASMEGNGDNLKNLGMFGVLFKGQTTPNDYTVYFPEGSEFGQQTLSGTGKAEWVVLNGGQQLAELNSKKGNSPAVVFNQYQNGKALLFSFDIGNSTGDTSGVLEKAIGLTAPESDVTKGYAELAIDVDAKTAIDGQIRLDIPDGADVIWAIPESGSQECQWDISMVKGGKYCVKVLVKLPEIPGEYTLTVGAYYTVQGESWLFDSFEIKTTR